jgi:hypothetical protein
VKAVRRRYLPGAADLERFISEQNIARYRKLLGPEMDESQRSTIFQLLESEFETLFAQKISRTGIEDKCSLVS